MNDCIFIVDKTPHPAPIDYAIYDGLPSPEIVISMRSGSKEAQIIAEQIVEAYNAARETMLAKIRELERETAHQDSYFDDPLRSTNRC